jgi:hypothetical protein
LFTIRLQKKGTRTMARFNPRTRTLEEAVQWRDRVIIGLQAKFDAHERARKDGVDRLSWHEECETRRQLEDVRGYSDEDAHRAWNARIQHEHGKRLALWEKLTAERSRYAHCALDNFQATTPEQQAALERVKRFAEELETHIENGTNVIFYGSCGSGKDHLLFALLRIVVMELSPTVPIDFFRGCDLAATAKETRGKKLGVGPRILAISDPVLAGQAAMYYEHQRLHELVDWQYQARLPVWVTVNASTRDEFNAMLTPAVADRLRDAAFALHCDWVSHRQVASF